MHDIAINENPENRKKVYEALLGSMLLVPVAEIPADLSGLGPGLHTATSKTQIQLRRITDGNQIQLTAAFTDLEALRNWEPNTPYLGLNAPDLFRLVMGTDIQEVAINPFDRSRKMIRPGGRVTRAELERLIRAAGRMPVERDTRYNPVDRIKNPIPASAAKRTGNFIPETSLTLNV